MIPAKQLTLLALFITFFAGSSVNAQTPDLSGTWTTTAACPVGPVTFTVEVEGTEGSLNYAGYGPEKRHATSFPVKVSYQRQEMYVHFAGPKQGEDFGSFQGILRADGTVGRVMGLQVNGQYCQPFILTRKEDQAEPGAPELLTDGLTNGPLFTKIMQGRFETIGVPTDHPVFNSLYGAYLTAYARHCAANPGTRPKDFVEMTDLQCVQQGVTATYYRDGTYTESAPYCTSWKDIPNGFFADPRMWEVKKKLDEVFLGDQFKHMFAIAKSLEPGHLIDQVYTPSPQQIFAAITTGIRETNALVEMNACDSPGLMRFQENLRLYALNKPFGIRADGLLEPKISIPAAGKSFEDPDYARLLEALIKGEARSWQVNKYVLQSLANPSVIARDPLNRPLRVAANYRYGSMAGVQTGTMTVTFLAGYPECLYFSDRPDACRAPDKTVVAQYIHGEYSKQNTPAAITDEDRSAREKQMQERAAARRQARNMR